MSVSRRAFIGLSAGLAAGSVLPLLDAGSDAAPNRLIPGRYGGSDLSGWTTILGDGLYAAPGEPPPSEYDIATQHFGAHSELRANIHERRIMAHNLTFLRITDPAAFDFLHIAGYHFRLPPDLFDPALEAQTLEGGIVIWDGAETRLDYHVTFQWELNRYADNYKEIAT